jgi:hypothetical protein
MTAMYFDWITWGIWAMGFVILVVWIFVPIGEFKRLLAARRASQAGRQERKRP